jgi:hypothetical protein
MQRRGSVEPSLIGAFIHQGKFLMRKSRGSLGPAVISVLAFVALANTGCAKSIAARHPHLYRRAVCVRVPGIENDAADYLISNDGVAVSGFHPEVVDRIAPSVRTVYEFDAAVDPSSVRHLPPQYQDLTCDPVFSMLPSKDAAPLPEASVDLLVHERQPERLPLAIAKKLATCPSPAVAEVPAMGFSLNFNVYIEPDGDADAALMRNSTLGDRKTEECFFDVLRTTSWSVQVPSQPGQASVSIGSKLFLADGPMQAPNLSELLREVTKVAPKPPPGLPAPYVGVFSLLTPAVVAGTVFIGINLLPRETAPRWITELNPVTRRPYLTAEEFEAIKKLTVEQILEAQIKATPKQLPPLPIPEPKQPPPPADPPPPPERPRREKPDKCPKIKEEIHYLIYAERAKTKDGFPQGYKGLAQRWREYATNEGKWAPKPDGNPGRNQENHLAEYKVHQRRLVQKLDNEWEDNQCDDKGHILPDNARQYAAQEPQLGPGKPLVPAATPVHPRSTVNVPQANKPSK